MSHITSTIDLGDSFFRFTEQWPKEVSKLLGELSYTSYATQRDNGISHSQCMRIGLGQDSYEERYNQENKSL